VRKHSNLTGIKVSRRRSNSQHFVASEACCPGRTLATSSFAT